MLALLAALIFILLNGFFVAAEFALVKVSTTQRFEAKRAATDARAKVVGEAVRRIDRYLSVTQLGITLASLGLGWIGEPAVEQHVTRLLLLTTGREMGPAGHLVSTAIAFALLTFAHVLLGELVPKLLAIQRSEETARFAALPLRAIFVAFRPLLWVLERATSVILRAMGMRADAATEAQLSEDEILGILAANTARTPNGQAKAELLERVVHFSQRTARHAMVHRVDVFSLPIDMTGDEATRQLRKQQYSRVLLTKGRSLDDVAGYLYAKDFLLDEVAARLPNLSSLRRDVLFVPETQSLLDVLRGMQAAQVPIAVVVDEYGGTSGIVTMEDLLEEIVGQIRDEFDEEAAHVNKVAGDDAAWDVDARATMQELRPLGVEVQDEEWPETVGTVVLSRLGRLPRMGDKVELGAGATAEVTRVGRRRVLGVRVRVAKAAA